MIQCQQILGVASLVDTNRIEFPIRLVHFGRVSGNVGVAGGNRVVILVEGMRRCDVAIGKESITGHRTAKGRVDHQAHVDKMIGRTARAIANGKVRVRGAPSVRFGGDFISTVVQHGRKIRGQLVDAIQKYP
jgi:hypothetical protein